MKSLNTAQLVKVTIRDEFILKLTDNQRNINC